MRWLSNTCSGLSAWLLLGRSRTWNWNRGSLRKKDGPLIECPWRGRNPKEGSAGAAQAATSRLTRTPPCALRWAEDKRESRSRGSEKEEAARGYFSLSAVVKSPRVGGQSALERHPDRGLRDPGLRSESSKWRLRRQVSSTLFRGLREGLTGGGENMDSLLMKRMGARGTRFGVRPWGDQIYAHHSEDHGKYWLYLDLDVMQSGDPLWD